MPGIKTHDIFYKQLYDLLDDKTKEGFPNYYKYNFFAQGHDLFIYHDFYKIKSQENLDNNIRTSALLQEYSFPKFVYNYLEDAKTKGILDDEQVRLFIGAGYAMHHLLDAYTHPEIIYFSGDHVRDPKNETWMHGIVENLIDIYMMSNYENRDYKTFKVYKDFSLKGKTINKNLINNLNTSLEKTYSISSGGDTFNIAFGQLELFVKMLKYDPAGYKKCIFDKLDKLLKGTSSFSYNRDFDKGLPYMNMQHEEWCNPMNGEHSCTDSFVDLYNKALIDGSKIVNRLETLCQKGIFNQDDIFEIIPNISSISGCECGKNSQIQYTKKWKIN